MYPQTAPELFQLSRPPSTSDLFMCALYIKDIADTNDNAELEQEMVEYRSMLPEDRTDYIDVYSLTLPVLSESTWHALL